MPSARSANPSICIIRLSAIGDVCNAATIVSRIRITWPNAEITWICGKAEAQLLAMVPGLQVVSFDKKAGWQGYRAIWRALKGQHFDALLHLQAAFRASVLTLGIRAKRRIGFHRSRAYEGQWLFTKEKAPLPKGLHVVDNYQCVADKLGCIPAPVSWPFVIPDSANERASILLQTLPGPFIALCTATSKSYKNWSQSRYIELITRLQQHGYPLVLIGGPADAERQIAAQINAALTKPILNLTGQTSLAELMAVLRQAALLVTPDTGPAHLAATQDTPVVGLYAHHNPHRVGPFGYQALAVNHWPALIRKETGKEPEQLPWRCRVKDKNAMHAISVDEVLVQIAKVSPFSAAAGAASGEF